MNASTEKLMISPTEVLAVVTALSGEFHPQQDPGTGHKLSLLAFGTLEKGEEKQQMPPSKETVSVYEPSWLQGHTCEVVPSGLVIASLRLTKPNHASFSVRTSTRKALVVHTVGGGLKEYGIQTGRDINYAMTAIAKHAGDYCEETYEA